MSSNETTADKLMAALQERAKELNCLYEVEEALNRADLPLGEVLQRVVDVIPPGWQHPDVCEARIDLRGEVYLSSERRMTPWTLHADLVVQGEVLGRVTVMYTEPRPSEDEGPFLKEEQRLIRTIADRLSHHIFYQELKELRADWDSVSVESPGLREWRSPLHLLRKSDKDLYLRIARKMVHHLFWTGCDEVAAWLSPPRAESADPDELQGEVNSPGRLAEQDDEWLLTDEPFELASRCMGDEEILWRIQRWMVEDRAGYFTKVLHDGRSTLHEVADALRRYHHVVADAGDLPEHTIVGLRVALIRRLLTEQLEFINVAKEYIGTYTFERILDRVVMPSDGHGKLGGKASGLLLAHRILRKSGRIADDGQIKVPLTWFVASSVMRAFIAHNDLEDVLEQKYKTISEVRREYPNVIQLFKRSRWPADIVKGLSLALDEFEDRPIIVRSSSLLEDRAGTAFSGKYKSLFLANQGTKPQRLAALLDAIAEVYASTFGPDPIEYRREHGLLDFSEEMGVLVQEVVGTRMGRYFLPAFAGVAFSNNEFRWSPRIKREDGLIRLVPGLGSRAVDRVSDDYPTLVVPKQPRLRVNASVDEVVRYAPKKIDLIDLEQERFRTVFVDDLLRSAQGAYPAFEQVFSVLDEDILRRPVPLITDPEHEELVVTFDGLVNDTPFVRQVAQLLDVLQDTIGVPVDIEFAHDGTDLVLLQCRTQSGGIDTAPAPIPRDVPRDDIVFTANRFISNGFVPDLTHLVYVDPERYGKLRSRNEMKAVGQAIGRLNQLLPRRRFALLGPGRWGSRGDIKLGVSVTYSDINNTALLVEIARKKGNYVPDLSFGTHFFQDLVEARIRYLPLYPDEEGVRFHEAFLLRSDNLLAEMLPELVDLQDVIHVIDVPAVTGGRVLRVLLNAEFDEALAVLAEPEKRLEPRALTVSRGEAGPAGMYWRWRMQMAEQIAAEMDPDRFGVVAAYVLGSTKNATAGPRSDLDLLIHVRGDAAQQHALETWLEGWSLALAKINYLRTGYRIDRLLDVHYVTDDDIANRTSWAVRIDAITDAARPLMLPSASR